MTSVQVLVDDEYVDGISSGQFWYGRFELTNGINNITVTATDRAGNTTTQNVEVIQDTSSDVTASAISLNLNDGANFGSNETLHVEGLTDDETADVLVFVENGSETNGPFTFNVGGTQVWGSVNLFVGTNLLLVSASDVAGNETTTNYFVVRDESFFFFITNPVAYQVANASSVTVSGVASPAFLNATITVNGVSTELTDMGDYVQFQTTESIALNLNGVTMLKGQAELDGQTYYCDPPVIGYETTEVSYRRDWTINTRQRISDYYRTTDYLVIDDYHWSAQTKQYSYIYDEDGGYCRIYDSGDTYCYDDTAYYETNYYSEAVPGDLRAVNMGWVHFRYGDQTSWDDYFYDYDTQIKYIKHAPTQETQWVLFKMYLFNYADGETIDPTNYIFRGQRGIDLDLNYTGFLLPLRTDVEYTITESDFEWPSFANIDGTDMRLFHSLYIYTAFTNDVLTCELFCEHAANTSKFFTITNELYDSCTYSYGTSAGISEEEGKKINSSLTIYYKDVVDLGGNVRDFDVSLNLKPDMSNVCWQVTESPQNSGILVDSNKASAIFRNPTKGGKYKFELTLPDDKKIPTQLWLPISGPDITENFQEEIDYLKDDWGPRYQANLPARLAEALPIFILPGSLEYGKQQASMMLKDIVSFGLEFDYVLRAEISDICGLAHDEGSGYSAGDRERFTLKGSSKWYVIDFAKRSNMGYAMAARAMGLYATVITSGPDIYLKRVGNEVGTKDSAAAKKSYNAGIDIIDGESLMDVIDEYGFDMQEPNGRAKKEWPNEELAQFPYIELLSTTKAKMEALTVSP